MTQQRSIVVVAYSPEWPNRFAAEAQRLRDILAPTLIDIQHIGSTSVPGLASKPIIDMLAVVRELRQLDDQNDAMMALGYEPMDEFGIAGRRFFAKGVENYYVSHPL